MENNELNCILNSTPRNSFEKKENELLEELYKYVYKDARSIVSLCELVFHYRKEIAKIKAVEIIIANDNNKDIKKKP